jgi:hypothetical protein
MMTPMLQAASSPSLLTGILQKGSKKGQIFTYDKCFPNHLANAGVAEPSDDENGKYY